MSKTYSKEIHVEGIPIINLHSKEYEHPLDAKYLNALKLNKAFDKLVKLAIEYGTERVEIIKYTGSNVRVTEKNMPYLYECVRKACEILDIKQMPKTYIKQDPVLSACTIGSKNPILVLSDSLIKRLNHEELMFVIGHELGHVKSEHYQYTVIGDLLRQYSMNGIFNYLGGGILSDLLSTGIWYSFFEWMRKSELTADRAGLLVCQDLTSAITTQAKLGGYPEEFSDYIDINTFLDQADEFEELDEQKYNKFLKIYLYCNYGFDHPWSVQRAKELMLWVQSGDYSKVILRGTKWLGKELKRLEKITDKAMDKKAKKRADAEEAIVYAYAREKIEDEIIDEDIKGAKAFIAKGQQGMKALQQKLSESVVNKKVEDSDDANESYLKACENEKRIRDTFCEPSADEIEKITKVMLGDLRSLKEYEQSAEISFEAEDDE